MSRIVLGCHADGLGDNVVYTTIPQQLVERGHEVWISSWIGWRNPEIPELLWKHHPYVRGITPDAPDIDATQLVTGRKVIQLCKQHFSPIMGYEEACGVEPRSLYPFLPYEPQIRPEFEGKVFCDPTSISQHFPAAQFEEFVRWFARWLEFSVDDVIVIRSKYSGAGGATTLQRNPKHLLGSIFEYCDLMRSCRFLLTPESGPQSLASAVLARCPEIKRPKVFALTTTQNYNDFLFIYPNIRYCPIGGLTPDYHPTW